MSVGRYCDPHDFTLRGSETHIRNVERAVWPECHRSWQEQSSGDFFEFASACNAKHLSSEGGWEWIAGGVFQDVHAVFLIKRHTQYSCHANDLGLDLTARCNLQDL